MQKNKKLAGKIFVFRHGETTDNKRKIFSGFRNPKLTEKGLRDAKVLALKLKKEKIDIGYASHLNRMKKTLGEVLKYHENAKIIIDERVIERSYGDLQGTSKIKLEKENLKLYKIYHRSYDVPPPNGESIKMVEKRVLSFAKEVEKMIKNNNVNVAVVCGNNSMRALRQYFEKLSRNQTMVQENTCTDYVEYKIYN